MTKARKLIDRSAFDATTVKMMGDVLDDAWVLIKPAFAKQSPTTSESARTWVATTILSSVAAGVVKPDVLRDEAISVVKLNYPQLSI
jgi:hypothetical protein